MASVVKIELRDSEIFILGADQNLKYRNAQQMQRGPRPRITHLAILTVMP
jgi:hypothetical protein